MATFTVSGRHIPTGGGPDAPSYFHAAVRQSPWPGGGTYNKLCIGIGDDLVEIAMIELEQVEQLRDELQRMLDHGGWP